MRIFFLLFLCFYKTFLFSQERELQHYTLSQGLPFSNIQKIVQDDIGYLWFASHHQLAKFDGKEYTLVTSLPSKDSIYDIITYHQEVLLSTHKGLVVISTRGEQLIEIPTIKSFTKHQNQLYICSVDGVYLYDANTLSPLDFPTEFEASSIQQILAHKGVFYTITSDGFWKMNTLSSTEKPQKIATHQYQKIVSLEDHVLAYDALGSFFVYDKELRAKRIFKIPQVSDVVFYNHKLWISTFNNGVFVYDINDFSLLKRFSKYNGLTVNTITNIFQDRNANIWFGTSSTGTYKLSVAYLNSFFNEENTLTNITPQLFFEDITVNYATHLSPNTKEPVFLKPSENSISFVFKTVAIDEPYNVQYQWTLNNQVSPWSSRNEVDFAQLESGQYVFTVQSKVGDVLSTPLEFGFEIDTPYYKKTSIQLGALGVFILLLFLFSGYYIQQIKRKTQRQLAEKERENLLISLEQKALQLQMNPHFVFNVLHAIKATGNKGDLTRMNDTIQNFASLLRNILQNSRSEFVSLAQELSTLKHYLSLEQQLEQHDFEYDLKTSGFDMDLEEVLVPPMLVQPFIENALKHGYQGVDYKGKITIEFSQVKDQIHCTIEDNGIGYATSLQQKKSKGHTSVAIQVTRERIAFLSGKDSFSITTLEENGRILGTKVWFVIPFKTDF